MPALYSSAQRTPAYPKLQGIWAVRCLWPPWLLPELFARYPLSPWSNSVFFLIIYIIYFYNLLCVLWRSCHGVRGSFAGSDNTYKTHDQGIVQVPTKVTHTRPLQLLS